MGVVITEGLAELGRFDIPLKAVLDADTRRLIGGWTHALIYEGEEHVYTGVITEPPGRSRNIGGRSLEFWLGGDTGPRIEKATFWSGVTKLANGDFKLEGLYWSADDDSLWVVEPDGAGGFLARVNGSPTERDVLRSGEVFDVQVADQYLLRATARRRPGTGDGRLIVRCVQEGDYTRAELAPPFESEEWTDFSEDPFVLNLVTTEGDAYVEVNTMNRPNLLPNPSFEDDPPDSDHIADGWSWNYTDHEANMERVLDDAARTGDYSILIHAPITEPVAGQKFTSIECDYFNVVQGEEYCCGIYGSGLSGRTAGGVYLEVVWAGTDPPEPIQFCGPNSAQRVDDRAKSPDLDPRGSGYELLQFSVTAPDGAEQGLVRIGAHDNAGGTMAIDDGFFIRHNTAWAIWATPHEIPVQAGRPYKASIFAEMDANAIGGELVLRVQPLIGGTNGDPFDSAHVTASPEAAVSSEVAVDFTAPDGCDSVLLQIYIRNVDRGRWKLRHPSLQTTDDRTRWSTLIFDGSPTENVVQDGLVVIRGATDTAHIEVVAEEDGGGWEVVSVELIRTNVTVYTLAQIIAQLLQDPDTGEPLLLPGEVENGDVTLAADWDIRRQTCKDALTALLSSGLVPVESYRVNPDLTVDVGTNDTLYTDSGLILTAEDAVVQDATTEHSVETYVTRQVLLGAELQGLGGKKRVIRAEATNPDNGARTWFGHPINRTGLQEDADTLTQAQADAKARALADEAANPRETVSLELSDLRAYGELNLGDTVGVWLPDDDIEDPDNPVPLEDGRTAFPKRLRVLRRTRQLGAGTKVIVRDGRGIERDITDLVDLTGGTRTTGVEVGDPAPDFFTSNLGGGAGRRLLRLRATVGV